MSDYEVGQVYAFVGPSQPYAHPLAATVIRVPEPGSVLVEIAHPDEKEPERQIVSTAYLDTPWDEPPSADFWPSGFPTPDRPWCEIAACQYEQIQRQRALVRRLAGLGIGIDRAEAHYAGRGGTERKQTILDRRLVLSYSELEAVLTLAETLREQRK